MKKTDAELITEANVIAAETAPAGNTKTRVAQMIIDLIESKPNLNQASDTISASAVLDTQEQMFINAAGGAVNLQLPAAASKLNKEYLFVKIDASTNAVTFTTTGGELISGQANKSVDTQWSGIRVKSNNVDAWIVTGLI
jgi:hypothetical protein